MARCTGIIRRTHTDGSPGDGTGRTVGVYGAVRKNYKIALVGSMGSSAATQR
jgi:hypothetical protein